MNLRLLLKNIKTGGKYFPAVKSLDERRLIHDSAASRVDYHHAILHLGKLGFADNVMGVFLRVLSIDQGLGTGPKY